MDRDLEDLPDAFVERLTEVLGSRDEVIAALEADSKPAVRVNTLKTTVEEATARLDRLGITWQQAPWCKESLFIEDPQDRAFGLTWEHQAGYLFGQDPASALPVLALDPQPGDRILDLCSAPGGKTTHLAARMDNQGLIVANDDNPGRVNNMISNLDRLAAMNVAVTQAGGQRLTWPITFDKALVDAPCSNLGHMHTSWSPVYDFSDGLVGQKCGLQRQLLETAFHAVRPGGTIVYSTCTLEPRENEGIVSWFLEQFPVRIEPLSLGIGGPGRVEIAGGRYHDEVRHAVRLHPGEAGTDGFFLAAFTKLEALAEWPEGRKRDWGGGPFEMGPEDAVQAVAEAYGLQDEHLDEAWSASTPSRLYATTIDDLPEVMQLEPDRVGIYLAKRESDGYRLSFDAATAFGEDAERSYELAPAEAIRWVSGAKVPIDDPIPWSVITCQGEPLGCSRAFGDQLPCYVPKNRRIRGRRDHCGFLDQETS